MSMDSLQRNQNNEEIYEWIKLYQETKDEDAQLKLVKHYDALVRSLSRKFSKGRDYDEDMFQVGMVGSACCVRKI